MTESGDTGCLPNSARRLLSSRVGDTIQLGKGADAGVVWIQAFHGDDDDDNGLVNPYEMLAYADLTRGTLVVSDITESAKPACASTNSRRACAQQCASTNAGRRAASHLYAHHPSHITLPW